MKNLITSLLFLASLSFRATAQTNDLQDVLILYNTETLPANAQKLGSIKVADGGLKVNCAYAQTIEEAEAKARKMGGNLIKVTELKGPDGFSSCYRLHGDVYKLTDLTPIWQERDSQLRAVYSQLLPDTASYALVYTYRVNGGIGPLLEYTTNIGDDRMGRMKLGTYYTAKVYKPGKYEVWARTEARSEVFLNVEPGKVYFVKCKIKMGVMVGQPELIEVDPRQGFMEINKLSAMPNQQVIEVYE